MARSDDNKGKPRSRSSAVAAQAEAAPARKTPKPRVAARKTAADGAPAPRPSPVPVPLPVPVAASPFRPDAFDTWASENLRTRASVDRSSRGGEESRTLDLASLTRPNAVLEVHFTDGSVYYTAPEEFVSTQAVPAASTRGGATARVVLPFDLASARLPRSRGGAGVASVERYAVSELTAPTALDQVFDVAETFRHIGGRWAQRWLGLGGTDAAAVPLAAKLCAAFENSSLDRSLGTRGGVLLCWRGGAWSALKDDEAVDAQGRPVLLFLHGTASSTAGSFGKLWTGPTGGAVPDDFEALAASHTLLGWDHRSLTRSPIDNTIELIDALGVALPQACQVDVMSHSRGGLVGELFALRTAAGLDAARAAFAEHFAPSPDEAAHPDHERIGALFDALGRAAQRFTAGSFVRVACPARGTLLADGRTDLFLSLMLRAVGLATSGLGAIVFDRFTALVKSLVAARADAKGLPGIEAMIPGSALTLALAHCEAKAGDRLRVVAGDAAARGLSGLLTLLADVFYGWHDHDFVVHTRSMFGGLKRTQPARSLRWENPAVSHFAYFAAGNPSRGALLGALAGRDDGFAPMDEDERRTRGVLQALKRDPLARRSFADWCNEANSVAQSRRPVLVVLAGIMGSELGRDASGTQDPLWLSIGALIGGQLEHLDLRSEAGAALQATGLLAVSYERLLEQASLRYNVLCFPFDWRQPIARSGALLVQRLQAVVQQLADKSVPVHVIAHSMGGLVARHALYIDGDGQTLWEELKRRNSRLLMLGTPNKGSYAPAQLLSGQNSLAQVLGLVARKVSGDSLARYGAAFPGLMQMLPQAADQEFGNLFDAAAWDRIVVADRNIRRPDEAVLRDARAYVEDPAFVASYQALCDDPRALYVAGTGDTPLQMRPTQNPWAVEFGEAGGGPAPHGIEFLVGPGGDGTVPWSSVLGSDRTWYADCEHGTLPDHTDSFAAYFELLESGDTRRLPRQAPRARSARPGTPGTATGVEARDQTPALRPLRAPLRPALLPVTDEELAAFVLHHGAGEPPRSLVPEPIEVRVVHGGLDFARYPLMVGHYLNDTLSGAAKRVDEKLEGQLKELLDWKLFIGASRTANYLRPNNHRATEPAYRGAILLGLGAVSELTPGSLAETVTRGVLRYAFEHMHRDPYASRAPAPVDLRLSSVLVGTQIQAVGTRDALGGILLGVWHAAQLLVQMGGPRQVRLRELEIIEIDEGTALDAAYELRRLMQRDEWADRLHWAHPVLETREGALYGYRLRSASSTWQRLVVRQDDLGGLNFALIGERARVESTQVYSDVASLSRFIDRVSDDRAEPGDRITGATDPALGSVLFQMLLPQSLKSRLANLDNTVLVVDQDTARYPWELLTPPAGSANDGEAPQPFVVHAGLVRQRVTEEFRPLPPTLSGYHALVVGAPGTSGWKNAQGEPLRFTDLNGAREEARKVQAMLGADARRPWQVNALISPPPAALDAGSGQPALSRRDAVSFEQVRVALLEKPYRLLHLCGHGVVDQWIRRIGRAPEERDLRKTGMVLSDQELLGAADVEQMSPAPEFVFINCCYSGREGDSAVVGGPPRTRRDAVLASSLALRFIEMGARAVVAAGWQVDDEAALRFAEVFYSELLGGRPFGEAVKSARADVHARFGDRSNTWGAYQCYGDPTWSLAESGSCDGADMGTSRLRGAEQCMSAGELAARIAQVAAVAGDKPPTKVLDQIARLIETLRQDPERAGWLADSRVRGALGIAYRELGDHRAAADQLQRGARTAYSEVQIGQLDLLVNSLARDGQPKAQQAARRLLELLNGIGDDPDARWPLDPEEPREPAAASERLCLLGSACMREAAVLLGVRAPATSAPVVASELYKPMWMAAQHFSEGYQKKCNEGDKLDRRSYALSNALLAASLAALIGAQDPNVQGASALPGACLATPQDSKREWWLGEAAALIGQLQDADDHGTFWRQATLMELHMARGVFARTLGTANAQEAKDIDEVRNLIDAVLVRWPSPIQLDSLRHRFELLLAVVRLPAARDDTLRALALELEPLAAEALDLLQPRYGRIT